MYLGSFPNPVGEFIDLWQGDKDNSGKGCRTGPANHVAWRADTTTLSRNWLYPPSQGSMNSATELDLWWCREDEDHVCDESCDTVALASPSFKSHLSPGPNLIEF